MKKEILEIDHRRIAKIRNGDFSGPVLYWMSRDQRVNDNHALLYAQEMAIAQKSSLGVAFNLVPSFPGANIRHYQFMIWGLKELESRLHGLNIPFFLLIGQPEDTLPEFIEKFSIGLLVTDFSPLHIKNRWTQQILKTTNLPFHEVDAHNIVPCRHASQKQEYAAYTIRPKINKRLNEFLTGIPEVVKHPYKMRSGDWGNDWDRAEKSLKVDQQVSTLDSIKSGEKAADETLKDFLKLRLRKYHQKRNDPNEDAQSGFSPYLHFGHISAQRIALEVLRSDSNEADKEDFIEELVVRKELSDNFCLYNENYDKFEGFPDWAKKTLDEHRQDPRQYIYSERQFENAETHDDLWNAAQKEMVLTGKMHGYLRMYWAKKILEWTESPERALETAIYLNDKYELDGRDPNGYAGIAWSIGGVHDRAWNEREIFGKIRYMSYEGCKRKFDVKRYIARISNIEKGDNK